MFTGLPRTQKPFKWQGLMQQELNLTKEGVQATVSWGSNDSKLPRPTE